MAGVVGTALMLLECSGVGAAIDLDAIPRPDGVALARWLTAFPSFGFLLSVSPDQRSARSSAASPRGASRRRRSASVDASRVVRIATGRRRGRGLGLRDRARSSAAAEASGEGASSAHRDPDPFHQPARRRRARARAGRGADAISATTPWSMRPIPAGQGFFRAARCRTTPVAAHPSPAPPSNSSVPASPTTSAISRRRPPATSMSSTPRTRSAATPSPR